MYELPVDRLYVTIFKGDEEDGLGEDTEAYDLWKAIIPEERTKNRPNVYEKVRNSSVFESHCILKIHTEKHKMLSHNEE